MPLFDDTRLLKAFHGALVRGVKIDVILREAEMFQPSHPLYYLALHKNFKIYDAVSDLVKSCKCRYVIADKKHLKFRFEPEKGNGNDLVDIHLNEDARQIEELIQTFDRFKSDRKHTHRHKF